MNTATVTRKLRNRGPRSTKDALLVGVQRTAFRTAAVILIGAVTGVAWGAMPQEPQSPRTFQMEPVAPVIERGPAIEAAR